MCQVGSDRWGDLCAGAAQQRHYPTPVPLGPALPTAAPSAGFFSRAPAALSHIPLQASVKN